MAGGLARGGLALGLLIPTWGLGPTSEQAADAPACIYGALAEWTDVWSALSAYVEVDESASEWTQIGHDEDAAEWTFIVDATAEWTKIRTEVECMAINVGDDARIDLEFRVLGVLTDPSAVSLVVTDPDGVETTYTYPSTQLSKTSTGVYVGRVDCTKSGTWSWRVVSTGAAKGAERGKFEVEP